MGWGWTKKESAEQSQPPEDDDQIHKDVLLAGRDACYKARDMFYACVEKNVKSKPTEIASVGLLYPAECKRARTEYEKQCRPTWIWPSEESNKVHFLKWAATQIYDVNMMGIVEGAWRSLRPSKNNKIEQFTGKG
ncbi:uncharacterized protein LOC131078950 isoform X2 [Cryptomeria japonica]|uniref:uncharacterized protein LOC131078950 isoform X2 n=1 Tax=Cryptomeria japonica TaxID=3369 RepID=UPI0025AD7D3B|nr:uncharacterized protein LOC131078950 isoform X2 [Cryptomeria japonica]